MSRFVNRRDRLRKLIKKTGGDALLVTNFTNVTYLTGFTGDDSCLLVSRDDAVMVSDFRYITQLEEECPDVRAHIRPTAVKLIDAAAEVATAFKVGRLAIEAESLNVAAYDRLRETLKTVAVRPVSGQVEELRQIKDKEEVAEIRQAARYAEKAFAILRATVRPDRTEKDLIDDLEHQLRLLGAQGSAFPPIVAAGPRAALPHARPTTARVGDHDLLLVDWGATSRGYRSDLTRVLVTGRISPKVERVYRLVLKAQLEAIAAIAPGKRACDIDAVARDIIAEGGFGKCFGHGLGHGIGLDIHEAPRMSVINERPLEAGMVVTVEPGIYLPGWGGVRIEDDVLVTKAGHEVLTNCPKQLEEMVVD
jgi:Xaa-Pro aminopeptidase